MDPFDLEAINTLIGEFRSSNPMSDLAVGVVTPDGTWISEGAPTSRYEIGSITKVFTAILMAEAVLQGKASLEDRASNHLGVPLQPNLASLLTHTSGLPRLPVSMFFTGEVFRRQPYAGWSRGRMYVSLAFKPLARDGARFLYSNLGFAALGLVLERVYRRAYPDLVEAWLAQRGLTNTSLKPAPKLELKGKKPSGQTIDFWRMAAFAPAGGIRSTIGDMVAFTKLCLGDDEAILLTQQSRPENPKMGLGWHIKPTEEIGDILWHNGGTAACRTFLGISRRYGCGVIVLNNTPASGDTLGIELLKAVCQKRSL